MQICIQLETQSCTAALTHLGLKPPITSNSIHIQVQKASTLGRQLGADQDRQVTRQGNCISTHQKPWLDNVLSIELDKHATQTFTVLSFHRHPVASASTASDHTTTSTELSVIHTLIWKGARARVAQLLVEVILQKYTPESEGRTTSDNSIVAQSTSYRYR